MLLRKVNQVQRHDTKYMPPHSREVFCFTSDVQPLNLPIGAPKSLSHPRLNLYNSPRYFIH